MVFHENASQLPSSFFQILEWMDLKIPFVSLMVSVGILALLLLTTAQLSYILSARDKGMHFCDQILDNLESNLGRH